MPLIQNPKSKIQNSEPVSFWLKVKPRSARERLAYDSSGELRLEVRAAPSGGEANQACISFFARALRVPRACMTIVSGEKSRRKLIRISGQSAQAIRAGIDALASGSRSG